MTARVISQSRQWLASVIDAPDPVDGLDIEVAIFQVAPPTEDQWHPAEWDPESSGRARVLVGPETSVGQLLPGKWKMRVRVVDYPELPHLDCGRFTVIL